MNMPLKKNLFLLLISVFGLVLMGGACEKYAAKSKVMKDDGETFQITVPAGWNKKDDLNESADLQAGHRLASLYVIVIKDSKEDMPGMSIEDHSAITRETLMESLSDTKLSQPQYLTIDNKQALQYEIRGIIDKIKIVYLHTTVESPSHFYQIVAWTLPSRWEKTHATLRQVTENFRELPPS